ncbi:MAG: PhoH family protein [Alphaproteobacteria bacterium]|nr:PhoH family protein [Alphaproteobacteria bacterium]
MSEKIITIESVHPVDIFGPNDVNLEVIRNFFPKLRIIPRDNFVKVLGEEQELIDFESKFTDLMLYYEKFGKLTPHDIGILWGSVPGETESRTRLISGLPEDQFREQSFTEIPQSSRNGAPDIGSIAGESSSEVLVHGKNGLLVRARTGNQRKLVESSSKNDLVFAIGPAGTGKTYTAVALAVRALKNKEIQRIILTRPAVEAGENLGFLPGDLKEKLDPYLQPLYDALGDMLPTQKLIQYLEDRVIEIAPLAFMRGRTLNNAFAILDEAQNTTPAQLKMFLTRMGSSAKFIVTGDITQIDLPRHQVSGLIHSQSVLKGIPGIDFVYLDSSDIIRHKLVSRIIHAYGGGEK